MNKIAVLWPNRLLHPEQVDIPGVRVYEGMGALNTPETAAGLKDGGFHAVICTGGIETVVRQATDLPIYVVTSGYIDVLESLHQLENAYGIRDRRVALLLHENNPIQLSRLAPFVQNRVTKFVFSDRAGIIQAQRRIAEQGFDAIVTGPTGLTLSRERGLEIPAYPLLYSEESLLEAVAQINRILDAGRQELLRAKQAQAAIDAAPYAILATDAGGVINLCSRRVGDILSSTQERILNRSIGEVLGDPSWQQVYTRGVTQREVLVRLGETDYFSTRMPIIQKGQIIGSVGTLQEVEQIQAMEHKLRSLRARGLTAQYRFEDIIFHSDRMGRVLQQARVYAAADLTVLIEGETGTGKEMVAQSIHNESPRRSGPFVAINCAALAESLLESELMGYEEGAFTGAKKGGKLGLFELAHNGTLFLDEVNQLSPALQSKLLRVIQERTVIRVGGTRMIPVNVRIIAASNESLKKKVQAGLFRGDLYYRINILPLQLPALRERQEDLLSLIECFARRKGADELCIQILYENAARYSWPGNIRELENYVWRSVVLYEQGICPACPGEEDAPPEETNQALPEEGGGIRVPLGTLAEMEKELVAQVVQRMGGNRAKAARFLGITRNTVSSKLR